jgi:hypothetical protein
MHWEKNQRQTLGKTHEEKKERKTTNTCRPCHKYVMTERKENGRQEEYIS